MRMRQALTFARSAPWRPTQCGLRVARPTLRHFADTHPTDELAEKQLEQPLQSTQTTTSEAPVVQHASSAQSEREERIAKAQIVFGSRLAGPAERKAELDRDSTYVAGIRVPPKPEEPDNCCMSGCVNCVWDRFREEFEEWAAKSAEAQAKLVALQNEDRAAPPKTATGGELELPLHAAASMDDDGGGSASSQSIPADPFADIPVGIREFMKTEKRLKEQQAEQKARG